MRIPLIIVAALVMTTSVATGQQVIPSGGEEDVRLYNRSPFDAAMVTLDYRGEDTVAPPLLLRVEPCLVHSASGHKSSPKLQALGTKH